MRYPLDSCFQPCRGPGRSFRPLPPFFLLFLPCPCHYGGITFWLFRTILKRLVCTSQAPLHMQSRHPARLPTYPDLGCAPSCCLLDTRLAPPKRTFCQKLVAKNANNAVLASLKSPPRDLKHAYIGTHEGQCVEVLRRFLITNPKLVVPSLDFVGIDASLNFFETLANSSPFFFNRSLSSCTASAATLGFHISYDQ